MTSKASRCATSITPLPKKWLLAAHSGVVLTYADFRAVFPLCQGSGNEVVDLMSAGRDLPVLLQCTPEENSDKRINYLFLCWQEASRTIER